MERAATQSARRAMLVLVLETVTEAYETISDVFQSLRRLSSLVDMPTLTFPGPSG